MFASEKSSLYRFLLIYIGSSLSLVAIALVIFFNYEKHRLIDFQNSLIKVQSAVLVSELRELHKSKKYEITYPKHSEFHSAIYDIDKNYIFGDFHPKNPDLDNEFYQKDYQENSMLFYVQKIYPYYLGSAYIIVRKPVNDEPITSMKTRLIFGFIIVIFFITLIAYWLGKLFLSPMRNSITLLDDFIKDTTHELNTPVSTILTNGELLKNFYPQLENSKELGRIESASKRLSRIYDDLAYLRLNHQRHHNIEKIDISRFLKERVEYFKTIANAKQIQLTYSIDESVSLHIDKEDITRIVDNLLGNALKYTMSNGRVDIILNSESLSVKDNGIGIDKKVKDEVFQRFTRANKNEGGFGLGLSIVADIVKYYNFDIELQSEVKKGTKVGILWKK